MRRRLLTLAIAAATAGCDGPQSALSPQGPDAASYLVLTVVMTAGAAAIFVGVMIVLALAIWRPRQAGWIRSHAMIVGGGIVFPIVTLTALLVYGLLLTRGTARPFGPDALRIEVVGEQFWWRVRYLDRDGAAVFETANEIRIPVGREVALSLVGRDVIHSFWVPSLAGKMDMIPGRVNTLRIEASQEGVYRGQCAEYCGAQHATMAFHVVAEAPARFAAWFATARGAAADPVLPALRQGRDLFLAAGCGACHVVRGTAADGELGPDLTRVGGRLSVGAGLLPNNVGTLAAWISSSQHLKPGNRMPSFDMLSGTELRLIAGYLESLK